MDDVVVGCLTILPCHPPQYFINNNPVVAHHNLFVVGSHKGHFRYHCLLVISHCLIIYHVWILDTTGGIS